MRIALASTLVLVLIVSAAWISSATSTKPKPSEDLALVTDKIARHMLDPDSMVLSDVISINDPTSRGGMVYICGRVRGKNGFGGYAQPVPFLALVTDELLAEARVVQTVKIADDDDQAQALERVCEEKASFSALVATGGKEVSKTLRSLSGASLFCRAGDEGACADLDAAKRKLSDLGWCSAAAGQSDKAENWRPCDQSN